MTQKIDAYRNVLARFASGVTVVSAYRDERPDGVTVSAFSAVSLNPPLVLACIGEESDCYELLARSERFAVNLLSNQQASLALAFAELGDAKAQALSAYPDLWVQDAAPLLTGCLAHIVCRRHAVHPGGDHRIVVGEVVDLELGDAAADPLVYFAKGFRPLAPLHKG
jgi:flavin reductase (DIM6/NTAB) family NADH-FMN oxidoreductase RutF